MLERAREQILHAHYADAVPPLELLLGRRDLTASERNQVLEMIAIARIANRDETRADLVLDELFRRDPEHRLSERDQGPVVENAFDRARSRAHEPVEVTLEHSQPDASSARIVVEITAGADAVEDLRVAFRSASDESFARLDMSRETLDRGEAQLPVPENARVVELEYYIEALAPSGMALARVGTADAPLSLSFRRNRSAPDLALRGLEESPRDTDDDGVFSQWWFWTAVGAVVVGSGVAGYVLLGPPSEGPAAGTLGSGALQ